MKYTIIFLLLILITCTGCVKMPPDNNRLQVFDSNPLNCSIINNTNYAGYQYFNNITNTINMCNGTDWLIFNSSWVI